MGDWMGRKWIEGWRGLLVEFLLLLSRAYHMDVDLDVDAIRRGGWMSALLVKGECGYEARESQRPARLVRSCWR